MHYQELGSTGIYLSVIGLGTVKIGRNEKVKYPYPFKIPNDKEVIQLLHTAKEFGINVLDTAPAYGNSEERLGNLWVGKREDWIIITKCGEEFFNGVSYFDFSQKHLFMSIHRSLKRLKTDYLDIVLIHSNGDDVEIIQQYDVFHSLLTLKKEGLIRSFGMSTKTLEGGYLTLEHSDVAMVTYNPSYPEDKSIIEKAHTMKKGILIKKGFGSGHLTLAPHEHPIQNTMKYIFNIDGVSSVIVGTINPIHLTENVKYAIEAFESA